MKRKFVFIVVLVLIIIGSISGVFADVPLEYSEHIPSAENSSQNMMPRFEAVARVRFDLGIQSGAANTYVRIYPNEKNSIDYVKLTVKILNAKGTAVKTWSNVKLSYINNRNLFEFLEAYKLKTRGSYLMKFKADCYKAEKIIDSISGESSMVVY